MVKVFSLRFAMYSTVSIHMNIGCQSPNGVRLTTMENSGSPNMVCTVNYATEDLQHKILYVSKASSWHMPHENAKSEAKTQMAEGTV